MNLTETSQLLAWVRVIDPRFPVDRTDDEADARLVGWHDLLGALNYPDVEVAAKDYYRSGRFVIQPSDIHERVRAVEKVRLLAADTIEYPSELDGDLEREKAYRVTWQQYVRRGVPGPRAYDLADEVHRVKRRELVGPPTGLRAQLTAAIAARTIR